MNIQSTGGSSEIKFDLSKLEPKEVKVTSSWGSRSVKIIDEDGKLHKLSMDDFMQLAKNQVKELEKNIGSSNISPDNKRKEVIKAKTLINNVVQIEHRSRNPLIGFLSLLGMKGYSNRHEEGDQMLKNIPLTADEYEAKIERLQGEIGMLKRDLGRAVGNPISEEEKTNMKIMLTGREEQLKEAEKDMKKHWPVK